MVVTLPAAPNVDWRTRRLSRARLVVMAWGVVLVCASWTVVAPDIARGETWKDNTGKFTVEAQFIAMEGDKVVLKKANGSTIQVPMARLDAASQEQAKRLAAKPPMPSNAGADRTPDVLVRELMAAGQNGNYRVLWDALPGSYQKDIHDVIHSFAENMEPSLWKSGSDTLKKGVRVAKEKKQFILGHPQIALAGPGAAKIFDPLVDLLDATVNSDLTDLEQLKKLDVPQFASGSGAKIGEKLKVFSEASKEFQKVAAQSAALGGAPPGLPASPFGEFAELNPADVKITLVSHQGDTAVLRMEVANKTDEKEWIKVEGKWMPKDVASDWKSNMTKAKEWTAGEMKQKLQEVKVQAAIFLAPINATLDQLLAAQSQEEFNQVVTTVMQQFQGAAPPGPGGARPFDM